MSVTVRHALTDADLALSLDLYNRVWPRRAVTPEEVAAWKRNALTDVELVVAVDGTDAGSAAAAVGRTSPDVCLAFVTVLPDHRGRGAGTALFQAVSSWAREHGLGEVETFAESDDDESIAFAERRGFVERSREVGLELDVRSARPEDVAPPDGVQIVTLLERPDLAAAAFEVELEASPDVPGYEDWTPPPRKLWVETHMFGPGTPPDGVVLALSGEEVVGYARLRIRPGGTRASHAMTGVKRAWRGRGVASALKRAQIAWAKANGIETLETTNEVRNEPMRRLNERLGYREAPGRVHLRGPLSDAT